jgi:beta-lactamase superfamily II metal-dependent hydrolase
MNSPANNELEVSVFGPGFGECSVVHLGDGRWIIVDSCVDPFSGQPVALDYLNGLGVSPSAVDLIVATHWHDDHVRGIATLVRECSNARVCVPSVLTSQELVASIIAHDARPLTRVSSGVGEMRRLLDLKVGGTLLRGSADRRLMQIGPSVFSHGHAVEVWTLSPSDVSYHRFLGSLARYLPIQGKQKRRVPNISPNECSVVVWVGVGPVGMLLGADLEEQGCNGWSAILASEGRPRQPASFFKVPHHGSKNAHHPEVWRQLLVPEPVFVLAPYNRGAKLPSKQDVARLTALGPNGYATSVHSKRDSKRDGTVGKMIKDFNVKLTPLATAVGQVRSRTVDYVEGAFPSIELLGGAKPLSEVHG